MARLSCLFVGFAMVACASASRVNRAAAGRVLKSQDSSLELSDKTQDETCGDAVTDAVRRSCYNRASFGLLPGFNTCGDDTCKCDVDSVITGEDEVCDATLYDEGRKFNPKELKGKGCECDHKANTMTCAFDAPQVCDQCKFKTKTAKIKDYENMYEKVDETFPIRLGLAEHGLPEEIQGVFWLTDQKASSSLVSFARSEDGGGLSAFDTKTGVGKVRVSGDRVWSFSDLGGNMDTAKNVDLVYEFNFDSTTSPRVARIIPTGRNLGNFTNWVVGQKWILEFDMYLLQCGADSEDPFCKDEKYLSGFDKSFVWQRRSYVAGMKASRFSDAAKDYKAVQVIKADGTKLPAFEHWMAYSNTAETGGTPDEFHYREIDNSIHCE